jgi:SAM-dependent methyltransferase
LSREKIIKQHYEPRILPGRPHFEILDWADAQSQRLRFEVLAAHVGLAGKSLLDVGCGLGDLYGFLLERGLTVDYTGVDISEKMIQHARRAHPGGHFLAADLFAKNPFGRKRFDVAFCSGTFNLNVGNNISFLPTALRQLFGLSRRALVFNLLHRRARRQHPHCVYYEPGEILKIVKHFRCKVEVIDDYLHNDFTVVCRPLASSRVSRAAKRKKT